MIYTQLVTTDFLRYFHIVLQYFILTFNTFYIMPTFQVLSVNQKVSATLTITADGEIIYLRNAYGFNEIVQFPEKNGKTYFTATLSNLNGQSIQYWSSAGAIHSSGTGSNTQNTMQYEFDTQDGHVDPDTLVGAMYLVFNA